MPRARTDARREAREAVRRVAEDMTPLLGDQARRWELVQREQVPDFTLYGDVSEVSRASTEAYYRLVTRVLREGLDPEATTPPPDSVLAVREYARLGLPLTSLLRAFRLAHGDYWAFWFELLRNVTDDADVLAEAVASSSKTIFAFVDSVVTQVAEEYAAEREQWYRSDAAARLAAMRGLLDGSADQSIVELERVLGYPLEREHVALLLWAHPENANVTARELQVAGRLLASTLSPSAPLVIPLGYFAVAVWAPTGRDDAPAAIMAVERPGSINVAVGEPGAGLDGFRISHEEAQHARRVALLLGRSGGALTAYRDIAFVALSTADDRHARRFVERELGALAGDEDTLMRLRATLAVYFDAGCNVAETGRRIGIHQNTVAHRLQRATELLGHPLSQRQLELRAALELLAAVERRPAIDNSQPVESPQPLILER